MAHIWKGEGVGYNSNRLAEHRLFWKNYPHPGVKGKEPPVCGLSQA